MTNIDKLIGQQAFKAKVGYLLNYAIKTGSAFPHTLISGPAGLGKSTFCRAIAQDLNRPYREVFGPSLQKERDIIGLFWDKNKPGLIEPNTILFIDEIHSVDNKLLEWLYGAMQDKAVVTSNGLLRLPDFTLLAGTTDPGKITAPLRSRFVVTSKLFFYSLDEILQIIDGVLKQHPDVYYTLSSEKDPLTLFDNDTSVRKCIEAICMGTPRLAVNLAKQVVLYAKAFDRFANGAGTWKIFFNDEGITPSGLNTVEVAYLQALNTSVNRTAGLERLAAVLRLSINDITATIEPKLFNMGLVASTGRGRYLTDKGYDLLQGGTNE